MPKDKTQLDILRPIMQNRKTKLLKEILIFVNYKQ